MRPGGGKQLSKTRTDSFVQLKLELRAALPWKYLAAGAVLKEVCFGNESPSAKDLLVYPWASHGGTSYGYISDQRTRDIKSVVVRIGAWDKHQNGR